MSQFKNLDTLRLWAAASVIFSHSFLIAEGIEDNEPLQRLTGEILGIYGVFVFFILSGFLITQSRLQSASTLQYLWKRFLRIYPAYFISILITVLVLCPFFTERSVLNFLSAPSTWQPVIKVLLFANSEYGDNLAIRHFSFYSNGEAWSHGSVINGVLWTIKIEILLYITVAILFSARLLKPWVVGLLAIASLIGFYLDWYPGWHLQGLSFGAPGFFTGSLLYFLFDKHGGADFRLVLLSLAAILLATWGGVIHKLFPLLAAYPLLYLGTSSAPNLGNWRRFGDLSYGMYLFGWPVQQVLRALLGNGWNGWSFFAICLPVVILCGWLSWHLIEKPALRLKQVRLRRMTSQPEASS